MTTKYTLNQIFSSVNKGAAAKLEDANLTAGHSTDKGTASETAWVSLFNAYLPQRYQALGCHVIDSENGVSQQIDVAVIDRQYTPFVWAQHDGIRVVPVEAVYAVFECKQDLTKAHIEYAHEKIESVRKLSKTSLSIPHAGGVYHTQNIAIIGGILTLSSTYSPFFSVTTENILSVQVSYEQKIDIGCVANAGLFWLNQQAGYYENAASNAPVTRFLFELLAMLQERGTVPMIDVRAYARWIDE
jgi:predicted alpha-1,6-mannanase (GH76 family)